ncbi:hypothetical protein [Halorussus halophilus]|uniref:hypothetical protein n=1 Tax=Halorussus halophilus TaxID=2650975 RepID=UPI001300E06C|nr:hypothetical protein [Halorussus halophilus]
MRIEQPSGEDTTDTPDSLYGSPLHETPESGDEKELYGSPCHDNRIEDDDEQRLYGDPQHEVTQDESFDPDLVFVQSLADRVVSPGTTVSPTEPRAKTTEQ